MQERRSMTGEDVFLPAGDGPLSEEQVRLWASANGLVVPGALHQFIRQLATGARAEGPYERALMRALSDHYYYGASERHLLDPRTLQFAYAQILPQLGQLLPQQYAGVPVPRLTPGGPAPQGDWVDPLFDPLYRYPDGTLTPFWPPSRITTTDYVDQTLRELLHYPPGEDTRAFVQGSRPPDEVGFLLGVEDMFGAMRFAHEVGSLMHGRSVASGSVLSGPRAFRSVLRRFPGLQPNLYALHTPFLVVVITEPGRERAAIAHNGRVVARVERPADETTGDVARDGDNSEPVQAFDLPTPTPMMDAVARMWTLPPPTPRSAWRALLDDMLDAVRAGRADEVGLYPAPPGSIALSEDMAVLVRPGDARFAGGGAPRTDPAIRRYAGIYHPIDVLAAIEARVPNATAQRLREAGDAAAGSAGLRALAARAYRGRIDLQQMPAEVAAFAAPYAAARACSADPVPDRRAILESAAHALGIDPEPFGDAALCAELAVAVESHRPA